MPSYREQIDDRSPGAWGFGPQGGRAVLPYFVDDADLTPDFITGILGQVGDPSGSDRDGRIRRKLPKAHPRWPWMFASRIENGVGLGVPTRTSAVTSSVEAPTLESYAAYPQSLLSVTFEPRPYSLLPDDAITISSVTWYDEDDTTQTNEYADEWQRYVSYTVSPKVELLTATQGQMVFRQSDSATAVSAGAGAPHLIAYPGHPRMRIGNSHWRIKWHMVPLRYVESSASFITRFTGYINQFDWWGFPAGSLLYDSPDISEPYVQHVPDLTVLDNWVDHSTAKLVDVTFNMMFTERTNGGTEPTLANRNWIAAGWNLQPWAATRKFYYATASAQPGTADTSDLWKPTFLSAPFELLFTDPDI